MIDLFPEWLQIFILSMIPGIESRYVVPFAIYKFRWEWWQAFPIAITGNIILAVYRAVFKAIPIMEKSHCLDFS